MSLRKNLAAFVTLLASWLVLSFVVSIQEAGIRTQWSYDHVGTPFLRFRPVEAFPSKARPIKVLLIHGLGSSKSVLFQLANELAHGGFDCTVIDLPGHGASSDRFNWNQALRATKAITADLLREDDGGRIPKLLLLGHSLGASLAIRTAREDSRIAGVIAISPAIEPVTSVSPSRLLILCGEYDFPFVRRGAAFLYQAATGIPSIPTKGAGEWENAQHTRKLVVFPWTEHSLGIFKPRSISEIENWVAMVLPGGPHLNPAPMLCFRRMLFRLLHGVLPLAMWVPFTGLVALLLSVKRDSQAMEIASERKWGESFPLLVYALAGLMASFVLYLFDPWRHLGLMGGAYLTGLLCLLGLFGLTFVKPAREELQSLVRPALFAVGAFLLVAICVAPALTRQLIHLDLETHRLWRLPWVLASVVPFCLFDELVLQYQVQRSTWWQIGLFYLSSRLVIALLLLLSFLAFRSFQFLLILMFPGLLISGSLLWLAGRWVQHLTGCTTASFIFSSLSTAWFFCVFFSQI